MVTTIKVLAVTMVEAVFLNLGKALGGFAKLVLYVLPVQIQAHKPRK